MTRPGARHPSVAKAWADDRGVVAQRGRQHARPRMTRSSRRRPRRARRGHWGRDRRCGATAGSGRSSRPNRSRAAPPATARPRRSRGPNCSAEALYPSFSMTASSALRRDSLPRRTLASLPAARDRIHRPLDSSPCRRDGGSIDPDDRWADRRTVALSDTRDRAPRWMLRPQGWISTTLALRAALSHRHRGRGDGLLVAAAIAGARPLLGPRGEPSTSSPSSGSSWSTGSATAGRWCPSRAHASSACSMIFQQAVMLRRTEVFAVGGAAMALGLLTVLPGRGAERRPPWQRFRHDGRRGRERDDQPAAGGSGGGERTR